MVEDEKKRPMQALAGLAATLAGVTVFVMSAWFGLTHAFDPVGSVIMMVLSLLPIFRGAEYAGMAYDKQDNNGKPPVVTPPEPKPVVSEQHT